MTEQPALPFSGRTSHARQASWSGAQAARPRAGTQADRLLTLYRDRGALTDHQAAEALGLPLATICARRNALVEQELVISDGLVDGPHGARNTLWRLR